MAQSLFQKETISENVQKSVNFWIALFLLFKKSNRTFSKCAIAKLWVCQGWAITHSLIAHFCSFQKSNCAITVFVAFLKSATKRAIVQLLFWKERISKKSANFLIALFLLFKKSGRTFSKCGITQHCMILLAAGLTDYPLIHYYTSVQLSVKYKYLFRFLIDQQSIFYSENYHFCSTII